MNYCSLCDMETSKVFPLIKLPVIICDDKNELHISDARENQYICFACLKKDFKEMQDDIPVEKSKVIYLNNTNKDNSIFKRL